MSPASRNPTSRLEEAIDAWWAAYCPSCEVRLPGSSTHCPHDGTALRRASIIVDTVDLESLCPDVSELLCSRHFLPRCPQCGSSYPLGETVCSHDGAGLCADLAAAQEAMPR